MKGVNWLLCSDDWNSCDWLFEYLPGVGVFSEGFCYWEVFYSRFEDELSLDCPKCGNKESNYNLKKEGTFKCKKCLCKFSLTTGTFIENSNIKFHYLLRLAWLLGNLRVAVDSSWISRDLGLTQKTTYGLLVDIKESLGLEGSGIKYKITKEISAHDIINALFKLKNPLPILLTEAEWREKFKDELIDKNSIITKPAKKIVTIKDLKFISPKDLKKSKGKRVKSKKPVENSNNIPIANKDDLTFGSPDLSVASLRKRCVKCKEEKSIQLFNDDSAKCKSCDGTLKEARLLIEKIQ